MATCKAFEAAKNISLINIHPGFTDKMQMLGWVGALLL